MNTEQHANWAFSFDDEHFNSGSYLGFDDALEAARDEADDDQIVVYIAPIFPAENSEFFPDGERIIEIMGERAYDYYGEASEDYLDVDQEALSELTGMLHEVINRWCEKHDVRPTFYRVGPSTKVYLTQE